MAGAGLGWVVRSVHDQRDAVAAIVRAGGSVEYDWQWRTGLSTPGGRPPAPRWLVDLIGVDFFGHVTYVRLTGTNTDVAMAAVGRLINVEKIDLFGPSITDAGMVHLTGLHKLSNLNLFAPGSAMPAWKTSRT